MKERKLLSAVLAASLLASTVPATAWASGANTEPVAIEQASARSGELTVSGDAASYEWQNDGQTLVITGSGQVTISGVNSENEADVSINNGISANIILERTRIGDITVPENASLALTLVGGEDIYDQSNYCDNLNNQGKTEIGGSGHLLISEIVGVSKDSGELVINGGKFSIDKIEQKSLTINGGDFSGSLISFPWSEAEECTINGGSFQYQRSGVTSSEYGLSGWDDSPLFEAEKLSINAGEFSRGDIYDNTVFGCKVAEGKSILAECSENGYGKILLNVVDSQQVGSFSVSGQGNFDYSNRRLTLYNGANVTVSSAESVNDSIVVEPSAHATLTLNGVDIYGISPAISLGENSNLTLILNEGTENDLRIMEIKKTTLETKSGSVLTIEGEGALYTEVRQDGSGIGAPEQSGDAEINIKDGNIAASGSIGGAAIGGGDSMKINISGGKITAIGDRSEMYGIGIGGFSNTEVIISGGDITAKGYHYAGIGSSGYNGSIQIDGGKIKASGDAGAAAIGGDADNIVINGGIIEAETPIQNNYGCGAAIGTSAIGKGILQDARIDKIIINGGTIFASSAEDSLGACIGGGEGMTSVGLIEINDGTVVTSGGVRGIGSSAGGTDTIVSAENGNPVVITKNISDVSGRDNWNGVFIVDNMNGGVGKVYGNKVTPTNDFTIPTGKTLEVDAGQSLIVAKGITATNNGTVTRDKNGVVNVQGKWLGNPVIVKGAEEGSAVTGITLDKSTLTLAPGKTATLAATVSPATAANKNIRWTSSNTGVVTVDATGKVTAAGNGTAVITASTVDGGFTAQCTVTVSEDKPEIIAVENVTLDKTSASLEVGETEQLTATVKPADAANKSVRWKSNDENVVSVDANGKLTAISSGMATVTVTTEEGNFTALCKVTVTNPDDTTTDTETQPDGSTVTTVEDVNGSSSSTIVDKNGVSTTTVSLSETVIDQAERNDMAVTLPMVGVSATKNMNTAPSVTVELPTSGATKVEIPVLDMTSGTVAVLVAENGNETIIPNSVVGNNGLIVTLTDGDTVKILDNTQVYGDVAANHWAKNNIDYVTSRGLFVGVDDENFAPETSMTRAMIVSVLQRYAGDTTSASGNWYEGARQWAMENGISDGTNMNGNVTREQLVTMLYRYIGSPQVVGSLADYSDNASVSPYAEQAMVWAVRNGIIGGMTADTLAPQGLATRAQVAAILERFIAWEQA